MGAIRSLDHGVSSTMPQLRTSSHHCSAHTQVTQCHTGNVHFNRTIVIAGTLSLQPGSPLYRFGQTMRASFEDFAQWLNVERSGLRMPDR